MAKDKKTPRPKAETPKGFRDYFGAQVTQRTEMLRKIAEVYHRYGFDPLETSGVETVEALGKFLPDVDRPNEGVFAWEEDGDWLALRYDLTAPLARVAAQYRNDLPSPYRRYAMGPVWRNEKPGPGRFRQFYQCDADTVGAPSVAADAEICAMLSDTLEAVGIRRGDYVIRVNHRKILDGLIDTVAFGRSSEEDTHPLMDMLESAILSNFGGSDAPGRASIMRTIDKFDKVGSDGIRQLLTKGRLDESGAFIEGNNLSASQADEIVAFLECRGADNSQTLANLSHRLRRTSVGAEGLAELQTIADLLSTQGYGPDRIVIDPSVVRGLGYYTGPVFEAELTFEVTDEKGNVRNFGSVAGGGRYDDLVKRFTGQAVPATGVSIGVDRLLAALHATGRLDTTEQGPVVVTVMDKTRMADYQAMVKKLRDAPVDPNDPSKGLIRAEVYLGNPKNFGNQLKYADKRNSPVAVIAGGDEFDRGVVQIKDLILGKRIAESATAEEWKDRPQQREVPLADLVTEVQKMLADQR